MSPKSEPKRTPKSGSRADPTKYTECYAYRVPAGNAAREKVLYCEDTPIGKIADGVGTPAYVYSRGSIEARYRRLDRAFGRLPHSICYAVKANSNLAVLGVLARMGSSFDIVSGGELDRLRRIGIAGSRIVFSGVGKTREEIREALGYPRNAAERGGILLFNVESEAEL